MRGRLDGQPRFLAEEPIFRTILIGAVVLGIFAAIGIPNLYSTT